MNTPTKSPSAVKTGRDRRRLILWGLGAVLALAAVIFAASALSAPKRVPDLPQVTVSAADQSRKDYTEALSALASGDTTRAVQLLEHAVAKDPGNTAAKKKLDELRSAPLPKGKQQTGTQSPATPPTSGSPPVAGTPTQTPAAPVDPAFGQPVSDMAKLLPTAVSGFVTGQKVVTPQDAELPLDPDRTLASRVTRVQLSVHDRGSTAGASAYVAQHAGTLYKQNTATVDVNGVQGKSGTDNGRLAAVIFSRGRYAFEVVVTSAGSDPSKVLDLALDVARTFPSKL